ncbi:HNH endonuclease [Paraferrimonas haliotis]|uniref:HNH endonuclease n=1 Tax=Paraferrimonas haliotis TaxID=2013866 RepID=UPI001FD5CDB9|nr:HNH endonuclease signature motif containing protein [Paraferrimonas haliotis]
MKLTVDLSLLNQAVKTMGAESIDFELSSDLVPLEPIDIQLSEGLEVDFKDIDFETGLASYEGRQVLLYIKDHSYNNKIYSVLEDGTKGNKYHIADCKTLEKMRQQGRLERYVVTNKLDGHFLVSGRDNVSNELITGETKLNVCQFCLEATNFQKFASLKRGALRRQFVTQFDLAEFFDTYSSFFKYMPTGVANTEAVHYTNDWEIVSKKTRERYNYQCQQCGLELEQHKHLLHVHHINGVKSDNRDANLTPLCCDCHRKQPNHQHMFIKHEDTKLINRLRSASGIRVKESWKEVYDLADPGMHGVIDLLEQSQVYLPEVGYELNDATSGVVASLELAWPFKKVGISVDKSAAIAAHKQGWKVYSMRYALRLIDELTAKLR